MPPDAPELGVRKRPRRKRWMTVAEVAKMRGCHKVSAEEWLRRHALAHMRKIDGVWTVPTAVVTRLVQAARTEQLLNRVATLEERCELLERRVNALASGHPRHGVPT